MGNIFIRDKETNDYASEREHIKYARYCTGSSAQAIAYHSIANMYGESFTNPSQPPVEEATPIEPVQSEFDVTQQERDRAGRFTTSYSQMSGADRARQSLSEIFEGQHNESPA